MVNAPAAFTGTWRLVSYEGRDADGKIQHPFGEHASGQLIYDEAGNMSAHVLSGDRPRFAADDIVGGTDAEVRAAFEGHVSYFGTYTVDRAKQTITHHLLGASYPNWMAHDQVRYYRFDDGRLVLSTPPMMWGGKSIEYVLTWERLG